MTEIADVLARYTTLGSDGQAHNTPDEEAVESIITEVDRFYMPRPHTPQLWHWRLFGSVFQFISAVSMVGLACTIGRSALYATASSDLQKGDIVHHSWA